MKQLWKIATLIFIISPQLHANVGGSDLQNFNPNPQGLEFVTVSPTQTLLPWQFNLGATGSYSINSLPYSTVVTAPVGQKFSDPTDQLMYSHLYLATGLMQGWDIGVSAGFINHQQLQNTTFLFSYGDTGINDIRLHSKARIYNDEQWGVALQGTVDFDFIKDNPFTGRDAGPSINLEAIADWKFAANWIAAVNGGYRMRQPGLSVPNTGITPLPDQWIYSAGVSYHLNQSGSAIIGEFYGSYPTEVFFTPTDRDFSNLEALLAFRYRSESQFDVVTGAATEIYHGLNTPDFRFFIGINGRFQLFADEPNTHSPITDQSETVAPITTMESTVPLDSDNDGVPDDKDQCPNTWAQNYVDENGCPRQD